MNSKPLTYGPPARVSYPTTPGDALNWPAQSAQSAHPGEVGEV